MRTLMTMTAILFFWTSVLMGQNHSATDSIMNFLGTDDPQEMDSDEVERLEYLLDHPLKVNLLDEAELRQSGIFSQYQVAVITDYISRHGSVKTSMELSYLDGFSEDFVRKVSPFIDLSVNESSASGLRHEAAVRGSGKFTESQTSDASYALKYRINASDRLTGTIALSRPYGGDSMAPSVFSGSLAWNSGRLPMKLIIGDFNARFGQGLTLWNNSFMTSEVVGKDTHSPVVFLLSSGVIYT